MIVGIDLGTSNTVVATAKKTPIRIEYSPFENSYGKISTPSIVSFLDDKVLVGEDARKQLVLNPENTVYDIKRLMGRKITDPVVKTLIDKAPFKIVGDECDNVLIEIQRNGETQRLRPEQITSLILDDIMSDIKIRKEMTPDKCIITVPASFNTIQRAATLRAAEIAELNCVDLINEHMAAVIACRYRSELYKGTVLVIDFGGGFLDVSIVDVKDDEFTTLAVSSNGSLGGEDFDFLLMDYIIEKFMSKHPGIDPRKDPRCMARLKQNCEEAKRYVSFSHLYGDGHIIIPSFYQNIDLDETFTRSIFESKCDSILEQAIEPIYDVLESANLSEDDITGIIMIGRSSHIPALYYQIDLIFDGLSKKIYKAIIPEAMVAIGANILGHKISNDCYINVVDVQSSTIGILHGKNSFKKLIFRNKPLPQESTVDIVTKKDQLQIMVLIGEDEYVDLNERSHTPIGKFTISNFPQNDRGQAKLSIIMTVDKNGILNITASCSGNDFGPIMYQLNTTDVFSEEEMANAIKLQSEMKKKIDKY